MVMKALKFKKFVTEASRFPAVADVNVTFEDCIFVINQIIYCMNIRISAAVAERDDSEFQRAGSRYFAQDWWLYSIRYCKKFKDPKINQSILTEIAEATNDVLGLSELDLASVTTAEIQSNIMNKAFSKYSMHELSGADRDQVESILANQLKTGEYIEILYTSCDTFAEKLNNKLADAIGDDDYHYDR